MKKIIKNKQGFSFIELLIAISIIMIISAVFVVNVRLNTQEGIETTAEKLATDMRYLRNLAISRAEHQFTGQAPEDASYPAGGYGIFFNGNVTQHKYFLFADNGDNTGYQAAEDEILYEVSVDPYKLDDENGALTSFWFTFVSEHEVVSTMATGQQNKYVVNIREDIGAYGTGYQGTLVLGELSSDGYVWSNIGTSYGNFTIAKPYVPPEKDPIEMQYVE